MPAVPKPCKPLSARQEKFAQLVAGGMPAVRAYKKAGYEADPAKNAVQIAGNRGVEARIAEIKAEASKRSDFKKDDLVRWLAAAVTTPAGGIGIDSPLCQEFTEDRLAGGSRGKLRRGSAPRGNEVETPDVLRRRIKGVGKIEAARLLAELLGWKEPEKREIDFGANTLDAIRERALEAATPLARRV